MIVNSSSRSQKMIKTIKERCLLPKTFIDNLFKNIESIVAGTAPSGQLTKITSGLNHKIGNLN